MMHGPINLRSYIIFAGNTCTLGKESVGKQKRRWNVMKDIEERVC